MGCQPQPSEEFCPSPFSSSAQTILTELKGRYPETPFLALGQTALWDEPTKATLRVALDTLWPEARLIAAVHDTDYFAKLPGHRAPEGHKFALVLHDDARTRGLWSAAGEMSQLFGSEDVPTRHLLETKAGVDLHQAVQFTDAPSFVLSELTAAWGWTGIIYTEWDRKVAREIALTEILPTLLNQIDGAVQSSAECLEGDRSWEAMRVGARIRDWVQSYVQTNPHASLPDLYQHLLPKFYELLLGHPAANLTTSHTFELLRFNTATASLPRFALVDLFLNPITRRQALDAYNLAVAGSDIYPINHPSFGEGAIPFDLVVPDRGRGTICIPGDGTILINTPQEKIVLCDHQCDFASVESLAKLVERELGPEVALVGKAVTLLPLLCAEHILVFHESASGYSHRTWTMLERMQQKRMPLPEMHPILRIRYATWDALSAIPSEHNGTFLLPEFLSQALGREKIDFSDLAHCWKNALSWEERRLADLRAIRSPRALLLHLCRQNPAEWQAKSELYESAASVLKEIRLQADALQTQEKVWETQLYRWKAEAVALERAKGEDFRQRLFRKVLSPESEAVIVEDRLARFDAPIAELRQKVREARIEVRRLCRERKALERGEAVLGARESMGRIAAEAARAKARQARNALQTVNGLPHTSYRPSSWWFPVVDPSGAWFRQVAATAEYSLEGITTEA